jgi:hypothetical protein
MIKKLLFVAFLAFISQLTIAQSFSLVYPFSSVTASTGAVDPTPSPTAAGVISGSFTANGLGANPTTTNVFAFQGWPAGATASNNVSFSGALDLTKYFDITLSAAANYVVSLTDMYFYMNRSNTGARHWAVRTNKDAFNTNLPATALGVGTGTTITVDTGNNFFWSDWAVTTTNISRNLCKVSFTGPNYSNQFTPYNVRFYAWDGTSTSGSWRIDSVAINGTATFSAGVGLPKLTHDLNAKFKLYPNPSNDGLVIIESSKNNFSKVEVVNLLGAVVASQNGILADKITLDLTTLPQGTYFVRISTENYISNEKLIISK